MIFTTTEVFGPTNKGTRVVIPLSTAVQIHVAAPTPEGVPPSATDSRWRPASEEDDYSLPTQVLGMDSLCLRVTGTNYMVR